MPRLFIAVDLPDMLKDALAELPGRFRGPRWVDPVNLHLTMQFIGEVEDEDADAIQSALSEIRGPPFLLRLTGVGRFPPNTRSDPRVLWVGLSKPDGLSQLHKSVENTLKMLGYPPDDKPFTPHITLARIQSHDNHTIKQARRFLELNAKLRSEPFPVREFHLIESQLTPGGSRYAALADYPLTE